MSNMKSPEQQAAERYPSKRAKQGFGPWPGVINGSPRRESYAACLRERAIPAEKRIAELEAAGDAMHSKFIELLAFATAHLPTKALDKLVCHHSGRYELSDWQAAKNKKL